MNSSSSTTVVPEGSTLPPSRNQYLKDVKYALEYKYLMKAAPMGIYLLPELENLRILHGVIFLRRGLYRDGIFRFTIKLPETYNDVGTYPEVIFTPPIFNPMINFVTGQLDLRMYDFFAPEWNPEKHHLVSVVNFIKKIFYLKDYSEYPTVANEEAKQL